jgi:hypothetical protein
MRAVAFVFGMEILAAFWPREAQANGRIPAANRIVLSPSNPDLIIARATYGVLPSFDHGKSWSLLCEDALGLPQMAVEDPSMGLTADNALVIGLLIPAGLQVSYDQGCNWTCAGGPVADEAIVDIAVRADSPHTVVALTNTTLPDDAGGGMHSQVYESADDGAHWTALGVPIDPTALVTTIDVAPSDPARLYVSATRGFGPTRTASLFESTDRGASWNEWPVPLDTNTETSVYIGGVDPIDADRVYLRTNGVSRLFVSSASDAGLTFQPALQLTADMLGFALSPDGATIYAGSENDGLFIGDRETLTFTHKTPVVLGPDAGPRDIHVQCLSARAGELWACADEPSGFIVGVSTDNGGTFTPRLHLDGVSAPIACATDASVSVACGADANASQCTGAPFTTLCNAVGCSPPAPPSNGAKSSGCGLASDPIEGLGALLGAAACAALWAERRRRRART